jgi:CubicO group peptidase (beta-lactamase class C family)
LFGAASPAQEANEIAAIDKELSTAVKPGGPGCAIGASRNGQTVFQKGYGLANLETATPNTPETIFYVASMAKQFTALAVMLLVREGKISLEDDARKYVPELPEFGASISLRSLLDHTSGLRDIIEPIAVGIAFRVYDVGITRHDFLYYVSRQRALNFAPGSEYSYNNTGYQLGALIVERVSGRTFPDFVKERIFQPLGMSNSSVVEDYTVVVRGSATGYDGGGAGDWHEGIPRNSVAGAGTLMTTVGDMLKWHEEVRRPKLFVRELAVMTEPTKLNSGVRIPEGLGLHLNPFRGSPFVYHGGGDSGHESFSGVLTERGDALVLLCNQFPFDADYFGREALASLAGIPDEPVKAIAWSPSDKQRQARVGTYASRATGEVFHIRLDQGELAFGQSAGPKLVPLAQDYYRVGLSRFVAFNEARNGSIDRMMVRIGPSRAPIVAQRLTLPPAERRRLKEFAGRY